MHKLLESQTVEFKQIWKDEYLKTICAFANSEGGILYIGLNDDAVILGVENIEELIELLPNKINNRLGLVVDIILKKSLVYFIILRAFSYSFFSFIFKNSSS